MKNTSLYTVPDFDFIKIISKATNIRQALIELGLKPKGGNYKTLKRRCQILGIKPPHTSKRSNQIKIRNQIDIDDLINVCKISQSKRAVLLHFGLKPESGSNNRWLETLLINNNINTNHWLGQAHLRGKTHNWSPKKPIEEFLIKNSFCNNNHLKNRLIKEKYLNDKCLACGIKNWKNQKLTLHLDHINGDHCDNRLENLRLLCPNCHSLTSTYTGKNKCR